MRSLFLSGITSAVLISATIFNAPALAEPYKIDRSHASVTFTVDHLGFSTTQGRFDEFDAEIDFDPEKPEASTVSFVINAASVDTGWAPRDEHIRGGDFLNAEAHPEMTFISKNITVVTDKTAIIVGDFTMRGVTLEEEFDVTINRIGPSPFGGHTVAGFVVSGVIDRTKYGSNYAAPHVGSEIPIRVDLEISPEK